MRPTEYSGSIWPLAELIHHASIHCSDVCTFDGSYVGMVTTGSAVIDLSSWVSPYCAVCDETRYPHGGDLTWSTSSYLDGGDWDAASGSDSVVGYAF